MAQPLLTLETLEPDRPFIEIDGERYDLALPDDFGLVEHARLAKLLRQATEAQTEADALPPGGFLDVPAMDRLSEILDGTLTMILRAPDAVRARLNSTQKLQVIAAFGEAVPTMTAARAPQDHRRRSTSGNSSPSSPRRTRAKRAGTPCRSAI